MTEHAPQTERHTEYLADNGRERRTADAHLRERTDTEDHQRIKDDVDDRTGQALTHRDDHVAAGLLDLLAHHRDHNKNTHADRKVRILDSERRNRLTCAERTDKYTGQSPSEDEERDAADNRQCYTVLCRRVRVLLAPLAQTACDQRVYADTSADTDRHDQHLQRIYERNRRQRILRILGHEDTVYDVVQRVDDHGDHRRQCHRKDQRTHFRGAHFILLFQKFQPPNVKGSRVRIPNAAPYSLSYI